MDDEIQENSANEEKSKEAFEKAATKPTFAVVVKNQSSEPKAELTTVAETTATVTSAEITPTNSDDLEIDVEKRKFFLAEAESAPKHLLPSVEEENLTKLMQAYSEQSGNSDSNNKIKTKIERSPLTDEPSCSQMFKAANFKTDSQNKHITTVMKPKFTKNILPPNTLSPREFINLVNENNENRNQQRNSSSGLLNAAAVAAALGGVVTQKPFTTVIAGTAVVIPTALTASKPAESPTPPIENSEIEPMTASSVPSIGSLVCRICHNSENPERLVSPCLCKGSLSYVHIHCLERWISTSRSTVCELCQFQYKTEQTLRYTCLQSLRMWYSRSMSRRALQEDCQMFSLLTLVAFGIIGTLLVGIQYYFIQGRHWGLSSMWTKGWLLFFLFTTLIVYFINIYMIIRSQLAPWYRWWQSARDIKLILENRKPFRILHDWRTSKATRQRGIMEQQQQQQQQQQPLPLPPPPQPMAASAQNSNTPQIPMPSITSVMVKTPHAVVKTPAAATRSITSPMLNKAIMEQDATFACSEFSLTGAAAAVGSSAASNAITIPLPPFPNKLHISVELTKAATEIIEIPFENIDKRAFQYEKFRMMPPMTKTTTANV